MEPAAVGSVTRVIGRIPILDVEPTVDCGRRPAKAVAGETFQVSATIFREGHGIINAGAVLRDPERTVSPIARMRELAPGTDRWGTDVTVTGEGVWRFHVEAWADPIASWHHDAAIKIPAGQDVELMLAQGALLFERAARRIPQPPGASRPAAARTALRGLAARMRDRGLTPWDRLAAAEDPQVAAILAVWPLRELVTRSRPLTVQVDRERALYGSWYEFFPRSEGVQIDPMGRRAPASGTLRTAAKRLDAIAVMGFDVVYLPPVHPIGTTFRKGRNNTLTPGEGDPGSPWAIGSADGGHDALHPDLGTMEDFDAFVARTRELGMEIALDLALQTSPDHPWVKEHPEWFTKRADGSIAYAENPPKKYQDIYPLNFDNDPEGIYAEVLRTVRLWMDHGVRIFRVDNPHTKPLRFWERLLGEIRGTDPDVLFLAEALTRPGSEEYMDSEKYQYRPRDWEAAARDGIGIADYITELNRIRRAHPALHRLRNLHFHAVDQPGLMCFSKRVANVQEGPRDDTVLVVANLDPYQTREATVWLDMPALGVDREFIVTDQLTGESYRWGHANYVRLDPATRPAHVFSVTPLQSSRTTSKSQEILP